MMICPSLISTLSQGQSRGKPSSITQSALTLPTSFINRDTLDGEDREDDEDFEIDSGSRSPRFMIYWTTITKTSTTTSYLSTSTIASVICTPSNFIYKTC